MLFSPLRSHMLISRRLELLRYTRSLGARPTIEQQLALTERRRRLQVKIDLFTRRGAGYINVASTEPNNQLDDEWMDADEDQDESIAPTVITDGAASVESTFPEQQSLPLPSSFPSNKWTAVQQHLARFEYELRKGQARDALHHLRVAIAVKSFLYRSRIRKNAPTSNYSRRLRSYGDANAAHMTISHAAKIYTTARRAMVVLAVKSQIPSEFQVLTKDDLVASTAVANSNESGQSKKPLSWIWHSMSNRNDPAFVTESRYSLRFAGQY